MYLFKNKHGRRLVSQITSSGANNLKRWCMLFPQSPDLVYPLIIYQCFVFSFPGMGLKKKKAQKDSDSKHIHAWCDTVTILLCSHAACFLPPDPQPPPPPCWMGRLQANLCISMSTGGGGGLRRYADTSPDATEENKASLSDGPGGLRRSWPSVGKGGDSKSRTALLRELTWKEKAPGTVGGRAGAVCGVS